MASEFQIIMQLEALAQKIEIQTRLLTEARQQTGQLQDENKTLLATIRDYERQLKEAKELKEVPKKPAQLPQIVINPKEIVKIVSDNPANTVSNAELKQKLDEYIQEIDRCIAHLSTLS